MLNRHSSLAPPKLAITPKEALSLSNKLRRFPSIVETESKIPDIINKHYTSQPSPHSDLRNISDRRKSFRLQKQSLFGSLPQLSIFSQLRAKRSPSNSLTVEETDGSPHHVMQGKRKDEPGIFEQSRSLRSRDKQRTIELLKNVRAHTGSTSSQFDLLVKESGLRQAYLGLRYSTDQVKEKMEKLTAPESRKLDQGLSELAYDQGFHNLGALIDARLKKIPVTSKQLSITADVTRISKVQYSRVLEEKSAYKHIDPSKLEVSLKREREMSLAAQIISRSKKNSLTEQSTMRDYSSLNHPKISRFWTNQSINKPIKKTVATSPEQKRGEYFYKDMGGRSQEGMQRIAKQTLTTKQAISLKRKEYLNTTLFLEKKLLRNVARSIDYLKQRISTMKIQQLRSPKEKVKYFTPIQQANSNSETSSSDQSDSHQKAHYVRDAETLHVEKILNDREEMKRAWMEAYGPMGLEQVLLENQRSLSQSSFQMPDFKLCKEIIILASKVIGGDQSTSIKKSSSQVCLINLNRVTHSFLKLKTKAQKVRIKTSMKRRSEIEQKKVVVAPKSPQLQKISIFPRNTRFVQRSTLSLLRQT